MKRHVSIHHPREYQTRIKIHTPSMTQLVELARHYLVMFYATGYLSLSQVENYWFRNFCSLFDFVPPSRQTLRTVYLPEVCKTIREEMKVLDVESWCLTTDLWTGVSNDKFLGLIGHFITPDWTIEHYVLGVEVCTPDENGVISSDEIGSVAGQILKDLGISTPILSVTIDNGADVVCAMNRIQIPIFR